MAIGEIELADTHPARTTCVDHERVDEHVADLPAVRAGIHANAAADGARDRRRELEPPESRFAGPM